MSIIRNSLPFFVACWLTVVAGCDPISTSLQTVRLKVTNPVSGTPIEEATVQLKAPRSGALTQAQSEQPDKEWLQEAPFYVGLTDSEGIARVDIRFTGIDHSFGLRHPGDWITGYEYICRVLQSDGGKIFRLKMEPGNQVHSDDVRVQIKSIGRPRRVTPAG